MQFPPDCDEETFLRLGKDTDDQWDWSDEKKGWWNTEDIDKYQEFYDLWRKGNLSSRLLDKFPYTLSLGRDSSCIPLLPSLAGTGNSILVTKSYDNMYHHLLYLRQNDVGMHKGVVLTGQPGAGKTTFLKFMLARLILERQVVLLCGPNVIYLFFRGKVYSQPTRSGFTSLPNRKLEENIPYYPIWTLIDMDFKAEGPPIARESDIWPIQATSPNPVRFKDWLKQYNARVLGLPLWNMEELMEGLRLYPGYSPFRKKLENSLSHPDEQTISNTPEVNAALRIIQTECDKEEVGEEEEDGNEKCWGEYEEDKGEGDEEDAGGDEGDECNEGDAVEAMDSEVARPPVRDVDTAMKILVRNATGEFGFAPDDVFKSIFEPDDLRTRHAGAVERLTYLELKNLVLDFSVSHVLSSFSHRIIAVHPSPPSGLSSCTWKVKFKSPRIAKKVMVWMRDQEDTHLQEMYDTFCEVSAGSILAGRVFEVIVHRLFSSGWKPRDSRLPEPISMGDDKNKPPTFHTRSSGPHSSRFSGALPLDIDARDVTPVNFTSASLGSVTLEKGKYYAPDAPNNPLFDSFIVDVGTGSTATLSVFQITAAREHGGSAAGYTLIDRIKARVRELLRNQGVSCPMVKTVYILVCPDDRICRRWRMPDGWSKHTGKAFCIRIPTLYITGKK